MSKVKLPKVLVCVTRQLTCERLIHAGANFVAPLGGSLSVVHVASMGENILESDSEGEALEYLYGIAKQYGADMTILRSTDVIRTLVKHARDKRTTHIILGVSPSMQAESSLRVAQELERQLQNTQVVPIPS